MHGSLPTKSAFFAMSMVAVALSGRGKSVEPKDLRCAAHNRRDQRALGNAASGNHCSQVVSRWRQPANVAAAAFQRAHRAGDLHAMV